MAYNNKEVSKTRPCPICGKPDYCSFYLPENGIELVVCKRTTEKVNLLGRDGNFYVFVGISGGGNAVFEEANQRKDRLSKEKDSKNCSYSNKESVSPTVAVKQMTVVDKVDPLPNKELDKIYRTMLKYLKLEKKDREYLYSEGWNDNLIELNQVVSFPEKDFTRFKFKRQSCNPYRKQLARLVMQELGLNSLRGVPGAYKDSNGDWTFAGHSGIIFPVHDVNHLMYRLRVRLNFRDIDADIYPGVGEDDWFTYGQYNKIYISYKGYYIKENERVYLKEICKNVDGRKITRKVQGKYRNFSSYSIDEEEEKKGFIVNTYDSGCESGNQLSFYYNEKRDDMYVCYLTEGEKKGIYGNALLRAPFVSAPGVNSWNLLFRGKAGERPVDVLKSKGVKIFIIAYDADKNQNEAVMKCEKQAVEALRNEGFMIGLAEWDMKHGKGIDDVLKNGHKPSYVLAK